MKNILIISASLMLLISGCSMFGTGSSSKGNKKYANLTLGSAQECLDAGFQYFNGQCVQEWSEDLCDADMWSITGNKPQDGDCVACPPDSTIKADQTGCSCTVTTDTFNTATNVCDSVTTTEGEEDTGVTDLSDEEIMLYHIK